MSRPTATSTLVLLLALTACADDRPTPATAAPAPVSPPAAPPSPSPTTQLPTVDWDDPAPATLTDGWSVGPCRGDAPLVCFYRDGQERGSLEVVGFPVGTITVLRETLAAGGSSAAALEAHAREHLESMRQDRKKGCGAGYAFTADEPAAMTAHGEAAVKTAFTGGAPGAAPTERVVRWVGLRGDRMVSLVLHATEDGACAPGLGGDLSTTDLADLEPLIDQLVETSPLPVAAA